jgi:hypothetical protein
VVVKKENDNYVIVCKDPAIRSLRIDRKIEYCEIKNANLIEMKQCCSNKSRNTDK